MEKIFIITTSFLFLVYNPLLGQCIADSGPDKVICVASIGEDSISLGGDPAAQGGIPPYTYAWDALYVITIGSFTITMTAADFLNDTTLSNPTIVSWIEEDDLVEFHLTITDAENIVCRDTTLIKFSNYYIFPGYMTFNIIQGDSLFLQYGTNISGGIPPYEYLWRPNHGLKDSTSLYFWAKPEYSISYCVTVTDSAGCSFTGPYFYYINVTPVSIIEKESNQIDINVFPNPCSDYLSFNIRGRELKKTDILIYDVAGRLIINEKNIPLEYSIIIGNLNPGLYFYQVKDSNIILYRSKFIVRR